MLAGDFASGLDGVFLIVVFDNGMDVRSVLKVYHFPLVLFATGVVRVGRDFCSSVFPLVSQIWLWCGAKDWSTKLNAHRQGWKVDSSTVRSSC
jgi:hypothetical protein